MAFDLDDLIARTKLKIADIAKVYPNEPMGIGDGSTKVFYALYPPIKTSSQAVYLDGAVQTVTTHYTIDNDLGRITFVTAPAANKKITIDYTGLYLSDTILEDIVYEAITELSSIYAINEFSLDGSDNIVPVPTKVEESILVLQSRLNVVESEAFRASRDAIRTARTGVSVDTTARATALARIIEYLRADLDQKCERESIRQSQLCSDEELKI